METFITDYNTLAAIGAIIMLVFGLIALVLAFSTDSSNEMYSYLKKNSLVIGFIIAWVALIGSLIYSNVIGYAPCELCWIQRIFIYPQAIIYTIALIKRDPAVFKYALALSIIGIIVAIYNNWIILGGSEFISCSSSVVSCTKVFVNEFGFVTIPFMSFAALLSLIGISIIGTQNK